MQGLLTEILEKQPDAMCAVFVFEGESQMIFANLSRYEAAGMLLEMANWIVGADE